MTSICSTGTSMMLVAYRCVWRAAAPLVAWFIQRKDLCRGVLPAITAERFGLCKPPGSSTRSPQLLLLLLLTPHDCFSLTRLPTSHFHMHIRPVEWQHQTKAGCFTLWIHGASVGECLSALPIIELVLTGALQQHRPARVVLSTTTPAARELLNKRLAAVRTTPDTSCTICTTTPVNTDARAGRAPARRISQSAVCVCANGPPRMGQALLGHVEARVRTRSTLLCLLLALASAHPLSHYRSCLTHTVLGSGSSPSSGQTSFSKLLRDRSASVS